MELIFDVGEVIGDVIHRNGRPHATTRVRCIFVPVPCPDAHKVMIRKLLSVHPSTRRYSVSYDVNSHKPIFYWERKEDFLVEIF